METALGLGADCSEMVGSSGSGIDDVFHKALVSVDGEGAEVTASTDILVTSAY